MKIETQKLVIKAIKTLDLSETQFANACGISQGMVNQMVSGKKKPGWETSIKIEKATKGVVTRYELRPDIFGTQAQTA